MCIKYFIHVHPYIHYTLSFHLWLICTPINIAL
jgi:hypothetical protein